MKVHFIVEGKPTGKGRPRMNRRTGKAYTPEATKREENRIRRIYYKNVNHYFEGYVKMTIIAYYPIAKSNTKKIKEQKLKNIIRPNTKPDIDNIIKLVADSLNGLCYKDDTQIVELEAKKYYSNNPRVEVFIEDIE